MTIAWTGPFPTVQYDLPNYFPGDAAVYVLVPIGAHQATLTVDDHHGHVVARVMNVTVGGSPASRGWERNRDGRYPRRPARGVPW